MKILIFYTSKFKKLYENYFLKSVIKQQEYEIIDKSNQKLEDQNYNSLNWINLMKYKIQIILDEVNKDTKEVFMYNDIDIQYFGKTKNIILNTINNNDIVFQSNDKGNPNAGIIICKSDKNNLKLVTFLKKIIKTLEDNFKYLSNTNEKNYEYSLFSDNSTINKLLLNENFDIKWGLLPKNFITGKYPSLKKKLNYKILLHHATCVSTNDEKIEQMEFVKLNYIIK